MINSNLQEAETFNGHTAMKRADKSSIAVSHATRNRINILKYNLQAERRRPVSLDDLVVEALDALEEARVKKGEHEARGARSKQDT
jgi:hypothetical protein